VTANWGVIANAKSPARPFSIKLHWGRTLTCLKPPSWQFAQQALMQVNGASRRLFSFRLVQKGKMTLINHDEAKPGWFIGRKSPQTRGL
jgi:hypothetical protein